MEHKPDQSARRGRGRPKLNENYIPEYPADFIPFYRNLSFIEREKVVRMRLTKKHLVCIKEALNIDYDTLADLLGVTDRVLHLRKDNEPFSRLISDKIASLLELYCYGLDVFNDPKQLKGWLSSPSESLNNRRPFDLIKTHPGLLKVRDLMHRMRLGQY
ncbi:antitoxin Xre/MbcA/ParS toxin-binding domain-containing protein [Chitinophaga lutea]